MKKFNLNGDGWRFLAPANLLAMILITPMSAGADTFGNALTTGKTSLDVRYRYESVEQANALKDADASTVRTRLGYKTGDYQGLSAFIEFENTTLIGGSNYNSKVAPTDASFSVIADPVRSEVNQAYLEMGSIPDTVMKIGWHRLIMDNARWVGNVGWRQNEQTFDTFSIVNKSLPDTVITFAYLSNAKTILGANIDHNSNLLNVAYNGWNAGKLTGYVYSLDFKNAPGASTQTVGLRFAGATKIGEDSKISYIAEFANQSDNANNTTTVDVDYIRAELGGSIRGWSAKLGYELLV